MAQLSVMLLRGKDNQEIITCKWKICKCAHQRYISLSIKCCVMFLCFLFFLLFVIVFENNFIVSLFFHNFFTSFPCYHFFLCVIIYAILFNVTTFVTNFFKDIVHVINLIFIDMIFLITLHILTVCT
jgi:hypothetical protein